MPGKTSKSGRANAARRNPLVPLWSTDKRRPVLVLTRDSALEFLGEVTVAPITSTIRDIPSEVLLTEEDGMPRSSVVNLDHLQTISRERLAGLITILPSHRREEVRTALLFALGFH